MVKICVTLNKQEIADQVRDEDKAVPNSPLTTNL